VKRILGFVWLAAVVLLLATRRKPVPPPDPPRMWDLYPARTESSSAGHVTWTRV